MSELNEFDIVDIPDGPRFDFDQHYTVGRQGGRWLPHYEYIERTGMIEINDPVWGEETIGDWEGDEIFCELYMHPVFQRLSAVEQLSLPERYATIPGTTSFSRWEHAWGSVVLARKLIRQAESEGREFEPREKLILQLRTFVSDAAQYAFSHLGDWLKQGFGGAEDSHDSGLNDFFELTGVNDILRRHDIAPEEVIFPGGEDWVECPSPDLCLDRVDYGVREIMRWVLPNQSEQWRTAFVIDDQNRLVMRNKKAAREFGSAFGLLATEHWSHPVHRMQLMLFSELIKGAILDSTPILRYNNLHPSDVLYTTDDDLLATTRQVGVLNNDLHAILLDLGRAQRRIYAGGRDHEVSWFMNSVRYGDQPGPYPHPLETNMWQTEYTGAHPQNIELIPVGSQDDVKDFNQCPWTFDMYLPALKPRSVDPLFIDDDGETKRLSDEDPEYAQILATSRALQGQSYVARMYLAPAAVNALQDKLAEVNRKWEEQMSEPRTERSAELLKDLIRDIGMMAIVSNRDIHIEYNWH